MNRRSFLARACAAVAAAVGAGAVRAGARPAQRACDGAKDRLVLGGPEPWSGWDPNGDWSEHAVVPLPDGKGVPVQLVHVATDRPCQGDGCADCAADEDFVAQIKFAMSPGGPGLELVGWRGPTP